MMSEHWSEGCGIAGFYEAGLREALREAEEQFDDASAMADVRRRVKQALLQRPDNARLLLRAADVLARSVVVQYRLDPPPNRELADRMKSTLEMLGDLILPEYK